MLQAIRAFHKRTNLELLISVPTLYSHIVAGVFLFVQTNINKYEIRNQWE